MINITNELRSERQERTKLQVHYFSTVIMKYVFSDDVYVFQNITSELRGVTSRLLADNMQHNDSANVSKSLYST